MADDRRFDGNSNDELESSLEDLLALAYNKKKERENTDAKHNTTFAEKTADYEDYNVDASELSVDDIISETNRAKDSDTQPIAYKATVKKIEKEPEPSETEYISVSDEDVVTEDMSIAAMVANAMTVKKGGTVRAIERVATEDDAISKEELDEMLLNDEMYDRYVDDDDEDLIYDEIKPKWYQNKFLVAGLLALALFLVLVGIVLAVFLKYYDYLKDKDKYDSQPGIQSGMSSDDTLNAEDYEEWLRNQLAGIADNAMSNENVTNVLIIAEDLRDTTGDSRGNTDVMILASINKENETLTLTSFMRDIYCDIPGYYADRLNSAYAKGGPAVLMDTLQAHFGVVVDKYVLVNFYSFIDVVEAIGGIEAEVTQAHIDAMVPPLAEQNSIMGNPKGTDYLKEPGKYILNGNQALAYSRIRYGVGDDFGRTSRQREVIFTAVNKAKELPFGDLKDLVDKILKNNMVKTNLSSGEVASLLLNCFEYMDYEQQQLQVPADGTWSNAIIRGDQVLSVNFMKNAKLIQETIYGQTNIDLENNDGEYVNTYTTPAATQPPQVYTTPEPTYTTTTSVYTTTPSPTTPVVTTTTPSPTTPPVTTTTPPATTPQSSQSSSATQAPQSSQVVQTTPQTQTTEPPETTTTPAVTDAQEPPEADAQSEQNQ